MAESKKLVWDATGERYYETGVSHGVYYPINSTGENGYISYGVGQAWNGLTTVTDTPSGAEPTDLYADDIKYATLRSAETNGGTIEAYTYPAGFAEADGSAMVIAGVYLHQQKRKPFAFAYTSKVGSDTQDPSEHEKIHIVFNATVSPSEQTHSTINDSPEAATMSWEYTALPVVVGGSYAPVYTMTIDTSKLTTDKKKALEDLLYGTDTVDPTLKNPKDIITLLGGTVSA